MVRDAGYCWDVGGDAVVNSDGFYIHETFDLLCCNLFLN